ncbi:recombinase family protein [Mycobacterium sp. B14F4]|uniref:recombinase family protein n=1 Tax=Mycobacterium sp. B14F4 TaxID=3153565 RepID=UPI00325CB1ED
MHTPTRTAIYTRISKDRNGESLGVKRQEQECRKLAARLGWQVVEVFSDNDISAYNGRVRPGFERLLDAIKNGDVDGLMAWHTDRLYRSMKDLERLIEIAELAKLPIRTVNSGELDLATSAGKMVARILGSVARQESEHTGERRKQQYAQKAAAGGWGTNGNRPFGYGNGPSVRPDDRKVGVAGMPFEPEASMFRQAVADVLAGKSLRGIAREWNASGVTTTKGTEWSSTRIRRILLNPRYAGIKTHLGKEVGTGDWTPLVDVDTYRGLATYLNDDARVTNTSFGRKWLGSGVYRCGVCGSTMRISWPGSRRTATGRRYTCSKGSCVMRAGQVVDDYVVASLLERLSLPDAQVLLDNPKVDLRKLRTRRAALVAKLDQLVAMFNEDAIDADQLRKGSLDNRAKIAQIDAQLAAATRRSPAAALVASGKRLHEQWVGMTIEQQAQALDEIAVVTILPLPRRGVRGFQPEYVTVVFKGDTALI